MGDDAKNLSMDEKLEILKQYIKDNKNIPVNRYKTDTGFALGAFVKSIKYGRTQILESQRKEIIKMCPNIFE